MTALDEKTRLDEKTCRELVEKLCSGLDWKVRQEPCMPYVLFTDKNRWCAFGGTWEELYASFCECALYYPFVDIPWWARRCSSPEELALKIEVTL